VLKQILIILIFLCILLGIVKAEESFDVYANNGTINLLSNINISNYVSTKSSFSGLFYFNGSDYKGQASFYTSGYLKNGRKQPVSIALIMENVTTCNNFNISLINCYGIGKMVVMYPKYIARNTVINNFTVQVFGGKVDISGMNASNNLFSITGMEIKKFYPGFIVIDNDSALEVTRSNILQPLISTPFNLSSILNFTPGLIGNTTYANNNVMLKNVGNNSINISVCGINYPGIVEFLVKSGTRFSNWITLPECDSTQPFNNGVQIVPVYYGKPGLPIGKEIVIYNSRITYDKNYTQGDLNFTITAV